MKQLESEGLAPEFIKLDISDQDSIQAARQIVEEKYGRLDVLINNAGINLRVKFLYVYLYVLIRFYDSLSLH